MRQLRSSLITTCALISCAPVGGINEDHQLPVVNAVLVSGRPTQSLTVKWAGTPDQPYPQDGPSARDVNLWILTLPAGDSTAVLPAAASGAYTIALTPEAGVTYQLRGTILGVPLAGTTTVPALAITAPRPGDTLTASAHGPLQNGFLTITVRIAASGAVGYGVAGANLLEGTQLETSDAYYTVRHTPDGTPASASPTCHGEISPPASSRCTSATLAIPR